MTLDEAIEILNRRKHGDFDRWSKQPLDNPSFPLPPGAQYAVGELAEDSLTEFEAVAVAEKYLRQEQENLSRS